MIPPTTNMVIAIAYELNGAMNASLAELPAYTDRPHHAAEQVWCYVGNSLIKKRFHRLVRGRWPGVPDSRRRGADRGSRLFSTGP